MQWSKGRAKDPVCGMFVDLRKAITRTVHGRTFYFCTEECAGGFQEQTIPTTKRSIGQGSSRTRSGYEITAASEKL